MAATVQITFQPYFQNRATLTTDFAGLDQNSHLNQAAFSGAAVDDVVEWDNASVTFDPATGMFGGTNGDTFNFTLTDTSANDRIHDAGSELSGTVGSAPSGSDTTPDQFSLGADAGNAEPGTSVQRTFTIAGIDSGETVTVTATGSASVNPSSGQLGDTITVTLNASSSFGGVVSGGAEIEGVSDSFSITTRAADVTPDQFSVGADVSGAEPSATVQRTFTVQGVDAGQTVSVTATGAALVAPSTAQLGDTVTVTLQASATFEANVSGGAEINGISDSFQITTRAESAPDLTPDQFDLGSDVTDAALGQTIARTFQIQGIDSGNTVNVTAIGAASVSPASGQLGDTITVTLVASSSNSATVSGGAEINGVSDAFSATTAAATGITERSENPVPSEINLEPGESYDLLQHFTGPISTSVITGSLPSNVTLQNNILTNTGSNIQSVIVGFRFEEA